MQSRKEFTDYWHLNELGGLELLKARYHQKQFSKHVHQGYCIGVIEEGAQSFHTAGKLNIAPEGDIIIVNADEVHTGSSALETGWGYRAIYPTPEMFEHLTTGFFSQSTYAPWFEHAVIHDIGLAQQLRLLFDVLEQKENLLLKETLYLSTLASLIRRHAKNNQNFVPLFEANKKIFLIKELMADMPEKDFSLQSLANFVGLSQWHFLREFKRIFGIPPHAWLIQARLMKAQKILKTGKAISDVALECGFSDQSHFNRHFKRAIGVTPHQYIARI